MTAAIVDQVGVCEVCRYDTEHVTAREVAGQVHGPYWRHITPRPHPARPFPASVRPAEPAAV